MKGEGSQASSAFFVSSFNFHSALSNIRFSKITSSKYSDYITNIQNGKTIIQVKIHYRQLSRYERPI